MKILLTTTSFQDTPGKHQNILDDTGYEVDKIRGPVTEDILLPMISNYDGVLCGDDFFSRKVIEKGVNGKLKVISKYGIGLDKIDLIAAKELGVHVTNCPGVNHITVSEHVFSLILCFYKNLFDEISITRENLWERMIGQEIHGKKIGVAGLGRIGKEVLLRAKAFGLELYAFDKIIDEEFCTSNKVRICKSLNEIISKVEILSLNMNSNNENYHCINKNIILNHASKNLLLINTARGELVDEEAILYGIENNFLSGYATDVLEVEPIKDNHPFIKNNKIIITPHIGSRTYQSVERQGIMAVNNLINNLDN